MRPPLLLPLTLLAGLASCRPELGDPESLLQGTRILAVRGDPAEAAPGDPVSYQALVVTPEGMVTDPALRWAFCAAPKPLTEDGAVSAACLGEDEVRPLPGPAATLTAETPKDACALFGPDTPPGDFRPRDPDVTGGYYQPVRVRFSGLTAFGLERVTCHLPNAPVDLAIELEERYHANQNPTLGALTASVDGAPAALDHLPSGAEVRLEVGWTKDDAETYPVFDLGAQAIVERREALRVSWFVTAGELGAEVTGRGESDPETATATTFRAPGVAGVAHLFIVLRDSRGGVDFAGYDLTIAP